MAPGSNAILHGGHAALHVEESAVEGSGPDGRRVTLILPVSFMPTAAGRSYPVAIVATANDGSIDEFDLTGTLWVGPSNLDSVDDGAR